MGRLATRLQGVTIWNEYQNKSIETRFIRAVIAAVIKQAIDDLIFEIREGYDVASEARYYPNGWLFYPVEVLASERTTSTRGRKMNAVLAPLAFIIGKGDGEWSFIWCCQQLDLDPEYVKRGILEHLAKLRK